MMLMLGLISPVVTYLFCDCLFESFEKLGTQMLSLSSVLTFKIEVSLFIK